MSKLPRASLTVTILQDEDFTALMKSRGGPEAFGLFVAILIAGRERFQRKRARQIPNTEALRFEDSTNHILSMACADGRALTRCLETFDAVTKANGSKPWLYLDKDNHLVIRTFFRWNTTSGWGGPRDGSGRKPSGNHLDSENNQDDSNLKSTWVHSGTGTGTGTGTGIGSGSGSGSTPLPPGDESSTTKNEIISLDDVPEYPGQYFGCSINPGPCSMTEDEAKEINRLLWEAFRNRGVCNSLYRHQRALSFEGWKYAIREAARIAEAAGKRIYGLGYVITVGKQFDGSGSTGRESKTGMELYAPGLEDAPPPPSTARWEKVSSEAFRRDPEAARAAAEAMRGGKK